MLAPLPARADELIVGALRDQDGAVVAGALVMALDARGAPLARDRSAADGTFALAPAVRPAAVLIAADDADPLRVRVPADGSPIAAIVRRHRSAAAVPTAGDLAALPAGSLAEIASVVAYRVAFPTLVSDRWLAGGRGVVTVEGLPFYRRGDGGDTTALLPTHAAGALTVRDALQAPWYGDRAGGGSIDVRLFDRSDAARMTNGDAVLALGRDAGVLGATSSDPDGSRTLYAAHGAARFGPLAASAVALGGTAAGTRYAGIGTELRAATQRVDLAAHLGFTRDDASTSGLRDDGSVVDFALDASGRGPNAIALRARWRQERGVLGATEAEHHDAALVFGTTRGGSARVAAALAVAYGAEEGYVSAPAAGAALLPSLALDAPLGSGWSVHAGTGVSTLGTPGYATARASLGEISLAYADHRRVRAELVAYAEGAAQPKGLNRGFAARLGWEFAPRLALRAWALRDGDRVAGTTQAYPGGALQSIAVGSLFDRDLVWLTWESAARVDVLLRARRLEANVRVPLGGRYALTLGTSRRRNATAALSLGLTAR